MSLYHVIDGVIVCRENEKCIPSDISLFLQWHLYTMTFLCSNLFSSQWPQPSSEGKSRAAHCPKFCALLNHLLSYSWEVCEPLSLAISVFKRDSSGIERNRARSCGLYVGAHSSILRARGTMPWALPPSPSVYHFGVWLGSSGSEQCPELNSSSSLLVSGPCWPIWYSFQQGFLPLGQLCSELTRHWSIRKRAYFDPDPAVSWALPPWAVWSGVAGLRISTGLSFSPVWAQYPPPSKGSSELQTDGTGKGFPKRLLKVSS